jgi:hypothetical chaperone protein
MNFLDSYKWKENIKKSYFFSGKDYRVHNLLTLIENNLGYLLFKQIEKCKIGLTEADRADFVFEENGIQIKETISIEDFECEIIHKDLQKIEAYLLQFLAQQQLQITDIDTIFMTGGTSYVRPLRNIFTRLFGADKIRSGDNFNSVAYGIAYSYRILAGEGGE